MHGGFTALNVQERNTKVIQLFFMSLLSRLEIIGPEKARI